MTHKIDWKEMRNHPDIAIRRVAEEYFEWMADADRCDNLEKEMNLYRKEGRYEPSKMSGRHEEVVRNVREGERRFNAALAEWEKTQK